MKKLFFLLFVVSSSVFGQEQVAPAETNIKALLSHQWLIKKMEHRGKIQVMPAGLKAYMVFSASGIFTVKGAGKVEQQRWIYVPAKNVIKLLDFKSKEDLGDLEIIKVNNKELVLYNKPDGDLVYLIRVD